MASTRREGRQRKRRWRRAALLLLTVLAVVGSGVYYLFPRLLPGVSPPSVRRNSPPPPSPRKAVYPYSVVRGGVHDGGQVWQAIYDDMIVAEHYSDLKLNRLRVVRRDRAILGHVSYRLGDTVYWTKAKHTIPAGEALISDGENLVRTRCGNRIAETPRMPVRDDEPSEELLGMAPGDGGPVAAVAGLPEAEYFSWIKPNSPPPYVVFALGDMPPLTADQLLATPGEVPQLAAAFPGYGPSNTGLIGGAPLGDALAEPGAPGNPFLPAPFAPEDPIDPPSPPSPPGPGTAPPAPPLTPPGPGPAPLAPPVTPPGPGPTPPGPGPTSPGSPLPSAPPGSPGTPPPSGDAPPPSGDTPPFTPQGRLTFLSPPLGPTPAPVPEPASAALLLAGLCALALRWAVSKAGVRPK